MNFKIKKPQCMRLNFVIQLVQISNHFIEDLQKLADLLVA
jgi:hypothetical protein